MGLLSLVAAPLTAPVRATWWVFGRIVEEAETELYDEQRILAEMRRLAADAEAGHITEAEHAEMEQALLDRLLEARSRRDREEMP